MWTAAAFHPSRKVKFALVPLVGLAVVAFAAPAHAGTPVIDLPPLPTEVTSVATDIVVVRDPVVASTAIEPAGDGSDIAAATVIEPSAQSPVGTEMPANKAVEIEADPSPAAADPAPSNVIPPPDVTPQPAPPAPAAEPSTRQYHAPAKQYQPIRVAHAQAPRIRPATHAPKVDAKPRNATPRLPHHASKLVQVMSRICADIDLGNLVIPVDNETSNSDWNVVQIGGCIVDQIGLEVPLDGVGAPSPCSSDTQYQPVSGQYQTGVEGCAPTSPAPGVSASPVPLGGPEVGASIPAFPASPISPPVLQAAPVAAPPQPSRRPQTPRVVQHAPAAHADHVLGVAAVRPLPTRDDVLRTQAHGQKVAEPRPAHAVVPRITGSRTRVEAIEAQPERVASNPPSPTGTSPWLVAAAMLLLFGLASLASALVGTVGTSSPAALRQLGVRATSRPLSKHPLGRSARGQRGIRYRD